MTITFRPHPEITAVPVEPIDPRYKPMPWRDWIQDKRKQKLEAASDAGLMMPYANMGLVYTVGHAYNNHYKLALSPDHVWLTILFGFSKFMEENAESVRKHFVNHEGQEHIELQADDFVLGGDNDWPRLFGEFNTEIRKRVAADKADLLACSFSTSSVIDLAAGNILTMSAMRAYFSYGFSTACGFPEIVLEGSPEDWAGIRDRVAVIAKLPGIQWWTDHLLPVVTEIARTAAGDINLDFWRGLYKEGGGSGGPYVSGWINALYPYMSKGKNTRMTVDNTSYFGNTTDSFPATLGAAPVVWTYYGTKYPLDFVAGVCGYEVINDVVRPTTAWAVTHRVVS